jgi:PAS domain S-box-containing protein
MDAAMKQTVAPESTVPDSERMLATLLANLPGMAYRCRNDEHGTMDFVSDGCRELTGYAPEDLVGNRKISYEEIIHVLDRARVRDEVAAALRAGRRFELTYRIVTARGAQRWVLEHGVAVPAVDGMAACLEGIVTDITARKCAEEALAEKESMLAAILDNSFQYTGLLDPDGRLLRANQTSLDAVEINREEVQGRFFWDTPWWNHSATEQQKLRDAIARSAQGKFVRFETTHAGRDGRMQVIDFSLKAVRNAAGKVIALVAEGRDITESKEAERALRESEDRFSKAFRASPDAVSIVELSTGRILEINQAVERIFGFKESDVVGRTSIELNLWADPLDRQRMVEAIARDGYVRDLQITGLARNGKPFICLFSAEKADIGGRACIVTVVRDITEQVRVERALKESEEKFSKAFQVSPDAISISDLATGQILDVNDAFERLSGYPREKLIGLTSKELNLWSDANDRQRLLDELRANGRVREMQVSARPYNNVARTFLMSAEPIKIGGRPCLVILGRDISEALKAEQALRESEQKFAKAFRSSPDAVSITDLATGRYIEANIGHEKIFGWTRDELIGRTTLELNYYRDPADRGRLIETMRANGGSVRDFEIAGYNRLHQPITVTLSGEFIELNAKQCMVSVVQDITERKRAEQALRESEEKFATAFRSSPYSLSISELDTGRYLDVNWGFERISGYRRDDVLGKTSFDLGIWNDPADRDELIRRLRIDGKVRGYELKFRNRLRELRITRCSCDVVELGGKPCLLNVLEDITEQRKAEEERAAMEQQMRQAQKLEALGQLAGGIAHDFNNILTGVLAYTELAIIDSAEPAAVRQHLAEVGKAGQRARALVRQILAFSRQQVQARSPLRAHPIVAEAVSLLRSSLPSTIEIRTAIDPKAPVVLADATQLHQIVMNLCTNAAHAMRDRAGKLEVHFQAMQVDAATSAGVRGLQPGFYAALTVSDTGHGMDADTLKRSFEPFFTTKGPGEGTGLGLAVVHGIVEDHDGAITVESRVGEGTTFRIFFPEHITLEIPVAAEPAESSRGKGERILFLDDEKMIADSACKLLEHLGYRVSEFTDPQAAMSAFERAPGEFDLVVTDLTMPKHTGIEVARRMLAVRPDLPVLLASGYSGTWTLDKIQTLGLRALIAKPLTSSGIAAAVRKALDEPAGMA